MMGWRLVRKFLSLQTQGMSVPQPVLCRAFRAGPEAHCGSLLRSCATAEEAARTRRVRVALSCMVARLLDGVVIASSEYWWKL